MYLKVHHTPQGSIVALCDADLLGTIVSDGKRHLDLQKYANFYQGKKVGKKEAVSALAGAKNANLVGKKSLDAAKAAGMDISGAISMGGIPHLQVYSII
jgi:hypothetical protein